MTWMFSVDERIKKRLGLGGVVVEAQQISVRIVINPPKGIQSNVPNYQWKYITLFYQPSYIVSTSGDPK